MAIRDGIVPGNDVVRSRNSDNLPKYRFSSADSSPCN
jgi:hypothetical protein